MKTINILLIILSVFLFSCNQSESNSNVQQPSFINNVLQGTKSINKIDTIHILPFGNVKKSVVDDVVKGLTDFYHKEIVIEKSIPLDNKLLAASKTRFSADSILKRFSSFPNEIYFIEPQIPSPIIKLKSTTFPFEDVFQSPENSSISNCFNTLE